MGWHRIQAGRGTVLPGVDEQDPDARAPQHPSVRRARDDPVAARLLLLPRCLLGATRSVPDVIQKCFGDDNLSKEEWPQPLDAEETARRKSFQDEFASLRRDFNKLLLSRVRVGTFHWLGVPPVQAKARVWLGQEYTGGPLEFIPSAASRQLPPETDPAVVVIAGKPLPVEPSWQDFTLEIPQGDGTTQSSPLFEECRTYLRAAKELVKESKKICVE